MILKNMFRSQRYSFSQARKQLKWSFNPNGVQIFYKDPKFVQNVVFYATVNIRISQLMTALQIKQRDVSYPQGVNSQTDLVTYLLDRQNPKALQIRHKGQQLVLRNRACNPTVKQIIQTVRDEKGIYQHISNFTKNNKPQFFIERCDYLTRYYLKLQAECYCRVKKINMNDLMSSKVKEQLLNYLNFKNQVHSQQNIEQSQRDQVSIRQAMIQTQQKIDVLNGFYEARESWYKRMAVLITLVHLVSFGYMIFGVDWLGWDIVEPLTYTAGVFYTLLGIRFYRKYKVDRSSQHIRQALFNMIMPPEKRVLLRQNMARLQIQSKQLKKKNQEQIILRNKLAYNTSLIQSLKNTIN